MQVLLVNPSEYKDATCIVKERLTMALRYFSELSKIYVLAQFWAPVKHRGFYYLVTSGQPFVLDPNCSGLHLYRMASLMYMFSIDGENNGVLDIPGRVFRHKLPEWSPNVLYYTNHEYQRLDHALNYNVGGTLVLPVFEPSGQSCIGVVELIFTSQKINYAPEVDKLYKSLEAVNLKSSDILDPLNTQTCNESRQCALTEILEVLTMVCETYNFPLAQTWVPCCAGCLKKSCSCIDSSYAGQVCMSTTNVAFYVLDAHMWGFREASTEHHLQKGQGVAGRAFATHSSCFSDDITYFSKTEYPLVHYARMFGLVRSFAISLRSTHMGDDEYILEFFLHPDLLDRNDQQMMLGSLLTSMQLHFRSLKFAFDEVVKEDGVLVEIIKASADGALDSSNHYIKPSESVTSNGGPLVYVDSLDRSIVEPSALNGGTCGKSETMETTKKPDRKRGKGETSLRQEALQQHFAGCLENGAKNLGVLDDELDILDPTDSSDSEVEILRIFERNRYLPIPRISEGRSVVEALKAKCRTAPISLTREDIEQQFGRTMKEAAKKLNVSLSTLKRKCKNFGISEWQGPNFVKTNAVERTLNGSCKTTNEDSSAIRDPLTMKEGLCYDESIITIKAEYADDLIKFHLPISSATFVAVEKEIGERFKMSPATYKLKYKDEDEEWILMSSDNDLRDCISSLRNLKSIVIRLRVLPLK